MKTNPCERKFCGGEDGTSYYLHDPSTNLSQMFAWNYSGELKSGSLRSTVQLLSTQVGILDG